MEIGVVLICGFDIQFILFIVMLLVGGSFVGVMWYVDVFNDMLDVFWWWCGYVGDCECDDKVEDYIDGIDVFW